MKKQFYQNQNILTQCENIGGRVAVEKKIFLTMLLVEMDQLNRRKRKRERDF